MKIMASWRKVHWSDESRFLLHVTDGRARVWRQPNTAYAARNILEASAVSYFDNLEPTVFFLSLDDRKCSRCARSGLNQDSWKAMEVWLSTRHASNLSQHEFLILNFNF
jgi:hypothetical protein